jgi:hypothetical protein
MILQKEKYLDDKRWNNLDENHKKEWCVPNAFLHILLKYSREIPRLSSITNCIETGTFKAYTTCFLAENFNQVYTIEKYPDHNPYTGEDLRHLYSDISIQYNNINFIFGDTSMELEKILMDNTNESFVIILDAHEPQNGSPILVELDIILRRSNKHDHVILIDDGVDFGVNGYPSIEEIKQKALIINPSYHIENTKVGRSIHIIY